MFVVERPLVSKMLKCLNLSCGVTEIQTENSQSQSVTENRGCCVPPAPVVSSGLSAEILEGVTPVFIQLMPKNGHS
ncbi:hypothetical protein SRHO_G00174850 [Serrasalmus rhombeus]